MAVRFGQRVVVPQVVILFRLIASWFWNDTLCCGPRSISDSRPSEFSSRSFRIFKIQHFYISFLDAAELAICGGGGDMARILARAFLLRGM